MAGPGGRWNPAVPSPNKVELMTTFKTLENLKEEPKSCNVVHQAKVSESKVLVIGAESVKTLAGLLYLSIIMKRSKTLNKVARVYLGRTVGWRTGQLPPHSELGIRSGRNGRPSGWRR